MPALARVAQTVSHGLRRASGSAQAAGLAEFEALERKLAGRPPPPTEAELQSLARAAGLTPPAPPDVGDCCESDCVKCVWTEYAAATAELEKRLGLPAADLSASPRLSLVPARTPPAAWPFPWLSNILALTVVGTKELRSAGPDGTRLVTLGSPTLEYGLGDNLSVFTPNAPEVVERLAAQLGQSLASPVSLRARGLPAKGDALLPLAPRATTIKALLEWGCEVGPGFAAGGPGDGLAQLLERAGPLQPRRYSIASSPLQSPRELDLVAALPAAAGRGRAASHLASLEPGDVVYGAVRPSTLPPFPEEPVPVLMVAAGSGVAPFRGFLRQATERRARGLTAPELHLLFGCRAEDEDLLFADELRRAEREGELATLTLAFSSRAQAPYVQDNLDEALVRDVLGRGGHVYICGNKQMAQSVSALIASYSGPGSGSGSGWDDRVHVEAWAA